MKLMSEYQVHSNETFHLNEETSSAHISVPFCGQLIFDTFGHESLNFAHEYAKNCNNWSVFLKLFSLFTDIHVILVFHELIFRTRYC